MERFSVTNKSLVGYTLVFVRKNVAVLLIAMDERGQIQAADIEAYARLIESRIR